MTEDKKSLQQTLSESLDEAEWSWLKPHAQRDALILIRPGLNLVEAGMAIANDRSEQVQDWIRKGLLAKPTASQIQAWDQTPARRFICLVIQPYVLVQEILHH